MNIAPKIISAACIGIANNNLKIYLTIDKIVLGSYIQVQFLNSDNDIIQDYTTISSISELSKTIDIDVSNFNNLSSIRLRIFSCEMDSQDSDSSSDSDSFYLELLNSPIIQLPYDVVYDSINRTADFSITFVGIDSYRQYINYWIIEEAHLPDAPIPGDELVYNYEALNWQQIANIYINSLSESDDKVNIVYRLTNKAVQTDNDGEGGTRYGVVNGVGYQRNLYFYRVKAVLFNGQVSPYSTVTSIQIFLEDNLPKPVINSVTNQPTLNNKFEGSLYVNSFDIELELFSRENYTLFAIQIRKIGTLEWFFLGAKNISADNSSVSSLTSLLSSFIIEDLKITTLFWMGRLFLDINDNTWKWRKISEISMADDQYEFRAVATKNYNDPFSSLMSGPIISGPVSWITSGLTLFKACNGSEAECDETGFSRLPKNSLMVLSDNHPLFNDDSCEYTCLDIENNDIVYIDLKYSVNAFVYSRTYNAFYWSPNGSTADQPLCNPSVIQPKMTYNLMGVVESVGLIHRGIKFGIFLNPDLEPKIDLLNSNGDPIDLNSSGFIIDLETRYIVKDAPGRAGDNTIKKNSDNIWVYEENEAQIEDNQFIYLQTYISIAADLSILGKNSMISVYAADAVLPVEPCLEKLYSCDASCCVGDVEIDFPENKEPFTPTTEIYRYLREVSDIGAYNLLSPYGQQRLTYGLCSFYVFVEQYVYDCNLGVTTYVRLRFLEYNNLNHTFKDVTKEIGFEPDLLYSANIDDALSSPGAAYFYDFGPYSLIYPDLDYDNLTIEKINSNTEPNTLFIAKIFVPRSENSNWDSEGDCPGPTDPGDVFWSDIPSPLCSAEESLLPNPLLQDLPTISLSSGSDSAPLAAPLFYSNSCIRDKTMYPQPGLYGSDFVSSYLSGVGYSVTRVVDGKVIFNTRSPRLNASPSILNNPSNTYLNLNNSTNGVHDSKLTYPFHRFNRENGGVPLNFLMPIADNYWHFDLSERKILDIELNAEIMDNLSGDNDANPRSIGTTVRPTYGGSINNAGGCSLNNTSNPLSIGLMVQRKPYPTKYLNETLGYSVITTFADNTLDTDPLADPNSIDRNFNTFTGRAFDACIYDVVGNPCYPLTDFCEQCCENIESVPKLVSYVENQLTPECLNAHKQLLCGDPDRAVWGYIVRDDIVLRGHSINFGSDSVGISDSDSVGISDSDSVGISDETLTMERKTGIPAVFFAPGSEIGELEASNTLSGFKEILPTDIPVFGLDSLSIKPTQARLELRLKHRYPADLRIILRNPSGFIFFDTDLSPLYVLGYRGLGKYLGNNYGAGSASAPPDIEWYDPVVFAFSTYAYGQQFGFDGNWTIQIMNRKKGDELSGKIGVRLGFLVGDVEYDILS
jgi:hypothetical protein